MRPSISPTAWRVDVGDHVLHFVGGIQVCLDIWMKSDNEKAILLKYLEEVKANKIGKKWKNEWAPLADLAIWMCRHFASEVLSIAVFKFYFFNWIILQNYALLPQLDYARMHLAGDNTD